MSNVNSGEMVALKTVKAFNGLAAQAQAKGAETLTLMWKAGEVAKVAKGSLPHGEWMEFVDRHYDVNHSTVCRWIKFHDKVPESKLCTVQNLAAGIKMFELPKSSPDVAPSPGKGGKTSSSKTVGPKAETPTGVDEVVEGNEESPDGPKAPMLDTGDPSSVCSYNGCAMTHFEAFEQLWYDANAISRTAIRVFLMEHE